jgi:tetratricopeptide (TPR) repeat protein
VSAAGRQKVDVMRMTAALGAVSDRTLNRTIVGLGLLLVVGLPTIGMFYVLDRHTDRGPSIAERQIAAGEAAVRAEPNKLSNRVGLALAYAAANRQAEAIAQFTEVLAAEPTYRAALLGRGDAYLATGDVVAAARDYEALVGATDDEEMTAVDPQREAALYGLGSIALTQNRPRDAATYLAKALLIDRTDADAFNLMGTALLRIGDSTSAIEALSSAIALVPTGWCDPYTQLSAAYTAAENSAGSQYAAGMVAMCEKRFADANRLLMPLVDGPFGKDALIGLGLAAEDRGDPEAAIAFYSRVYVADPTDFDAIAGLNRLGAGAPSIAPGADGTPGSTGLPGATPPASSASGAGGG